MRAAPFHWALEDGTKPVPVSVTTMFASVTYKAGALAKITGTGLLMGSVAGAEVPPPGVGFATVTCTVAPLLMEFAATEACSCVLLTKVVVSAVPFHITTDEDTKPEPFTVRVVAEVPAARDVGEVEDTTGAGFTTAKALADELPPPGLGFVTVTCPLPVDVTSDACKVIVNCVALTKVVGRALPFQDAVEDEMNPDPVTVIWRFAAPTVVVPGDNEVMEGTGFDVV